MDMVTYPYPNLSKYDSKSTNKVHMTILGLSYVTYLNRHRILVPYILHPKTKKLTHYNKVNYNTLFHTSRQLRRQEPRSHVELSQTDNGMSQIPECVRHIPHNAPFCNRNVPTCAHFCFKVVHYGTWDWRIVVFVRRIYCVAVFPVASPLSDNLRPFPSQSPGAPVV